jgi:hypothetical protein
MILSDLEQKTILASLQNGLGLTSACMGLHRSPKEVSEFIQANQEFQLECNKILIRGYQTIMGALNDSGSKKRWDKWKDNKDYLAHFITTLNLWESICRPADYSFERFTVAIKRCKLIEETATAMGMTDIELWDRIYKDEKLVQWLMQNGYQI